MVPSSRWLIASERISSSVTGVADDVGVALGQPEDPVDVEPGVHAGHDGQVLGRRQRQRAGEGPVVLRVVGEQVVGDGHRIPLKRAVHVPTGSPGNTIVAGRREASAPEEHLRNGVGAI